LSATIQLEEHLPLVHHVAKRFWGVAKRIGEDYDDLVGAGNVGLVAARNRYDQSLGINFSTYAVPLIYGSIQKHLRDCSYRVKIARHPKMYANKIKRMGVEDESDQQIANRFGISLEVAKRAKCAVNAAAVLSIDVSLTADAETDTVKDSLPSHADYSGIFVNDFISTLPELERKVLELRMRGMTQVNIGLATGVKQMHVSRLLSRIGKKFNLYLRG